MKRRLRLAAAAAALLMLTACGTSGTLSGEEAEQMVNEMIADANGVLSDAGLDITIDTTVPGGDAVEEAAPAS